MKYMQSGEVAQHITDTYRFAAKNTDLPLYGIDTYTTMHRVDAWVMAPGRSTDPATHELGQKVVERWVQTHPGVKRTGQAYWDPSYVKQLFYPNLCSNFRLLGPAYTGRYGLLHKHRRGLEVVAKMLEDLRAPVDHSKLHIDKSHGVDFHADLYTPDKAQRGRGLELVQGVLERESRVRINDDLSSGQVTGRLRGGLGTLSIVFGTKDWS